VITLSAWSVGLISRVTRVAVLDTLTQDFIVTARAKGIGARRIVLDHLIPNSLIPVVTIIGLQFGGLIGGAVVTETVFNYPGLGLLIVENIFARDYPVVQGAILLSALAFMVINLTTDLLYAYLDPRIRYDRQ
jgi:ABC-type dipeptide/oligopeptide/nickel transport system permease component